MASSDLSTVGREYAEKQLDFDKYTKENNIRYGVSYTDFDDLIDYFDISRLPDIDGTTMPLVGHIIFTRPSLNVNAYYENDTNYSTMKNLPMTSAFVTDRYGKKLLHRLSCNSDSFYLPLFTSRAMSYSTNDVQLKTVEKAQTFYGHVIKYGKHSQEHKVGGSITIDFRNDRYMSILKTIYIWMAYIWNVSRNDKIVPKEGYQANGILDYAGSIYYLVTAMDMSRLVYWEKLTGVFPKSAPFSIFSYNDTPIVEDKISVEFDYGVRSDPCDPDVLYDLNVLSGGSGAASYTSFGLDGIDPGRLARPDSYEGPFAKGNSLCTKPIIKVSKNTNDNSIAYFLQWMSVKSRSGFSSSQTRGASRDDVLKQYASYATKFMQAYAAYSLL